VHQEAKDAERVVEKATATTDNVVANTPEAITTGYNSFKSDHDYRFTNNKITEALNLYPINFDPDHRWRYDAASTPIKKLGSLINSTRVNRDNFETRVTNKTFR